MLKSTRQIFESVMYSYVAINQFMTAGVERVHDDLKDNWDSDASYDFNDDDLDPSPRMTEDSENM